MPVRIDYCPALETMLLQNILDAWGKSPGIDHYCVLMALTPNNVTVG
jgi:hypothetical protein